MTDNEVEAIFEAVCSVADGDTLEIFPTLPSDDSDLTEDEVCLEVHCTQDRGKDSGDNCNVVILSRERAESLMFALAKHLGRYPSAEIIKAAILADRKASRYASLQE